MNFIELLNNEELANALRLQNIIEPTTIQIDTFSLIYSGKNVIARSQTGSGKTLAYLLPIIKTIDFNSKEIKAVVIVPTYELAIQVNKQLEQLSKNGIAIRHAALIGNGNINRQIEALKLKPHIIVGTAGRIHELIKMKKISAPTVKYFVVDEADKMMDKNNLDTLLQLKKCFYKDITTIMFSASMNNKAFETAKSICNDATIIKYDNSLVPTTISHMYIVCNRNQKIETLRSLCSALKPDKSIIFINTNYDINEAYNKLLYHHYKIENICGNLDKNQRKNAIERIKTGKSNYLIATDIASRGLQIDNVDVVINVNLPTNSDDYLHRCGRCGRNGNKGICISIITENELNLIKSYQKSLKINFLSKKLYKGQLVRA